MVKGSKCIGSIQNFMKRKVYSFVKEILLDSKKLDKIIFETNWLILLSTIITNEGKETIYLRLLLKALS